MIKLSTNASMLLAAMESTRTTFLMSIRGTMILASIRERMYRFPDGYLTLGIS